MEALPPPLNYVRGNENRDPFPGRSASGVSGAMLIRGPFGSDVDPASAVHYSVLHRVRDTEMRYARVAVNGKLPIPRPDKLQSQR
jgi:hypothetical protein